MENNLEARQGRPIMLKQCIHRNKIILKKTISEEIEDTWNNKVRKLTMQGDFTSLLIEEDTSVTGQSIVKKMPRNVIAFAA